MRKFTAAQKDVAMTRLLSSQAGRSSIAANIQEPLRTLRDYSGVGRKALMIDDLASGSLPVYDQDIDTPAFVVSEEGDSIQRVVKSKRLLVPLFELASYPKIPFTQVKERKFDVIKRIKEKVKTEMFRKEDQLIFSAIDQATSASTTNVPIIVAAVDFDMGVLADAFARVERNGHRVDKIYMNPMQFPVIRKAGRDYVDFETQREMLKTGLMGNLYGANIYQSMEVPAGAIYLVTEPEYFGVMPVRIDLTVISADDPGNRAFGWSVFQNFGIGIHNADLGAQKITVVP